MKNRLLTLFIVLLAVLGVSAQPVMKKVQVALIPDHADALYKVGGAGEVQGRSHGLVYYAFGYNDLTCGPTTSQATYNAIEAPKTVVIGANEGHWLFPEHIGGMWTWMIEELSK